MKFVLFYHSLLSDWNHGNAHFLRGLASELVERGHQVEVHEPADGWSLSNLRAEQGEGPLKAFANAYPKLSTNLYRSLDLRKALEDADLVLVHEWNDPKLVARVGHERQRGHFALFFHDTHHRMLTAREQIDLRSESLRWRFSVRARSYQSLSGNGPNQKSLDLARGGRCTCLPAARGCSQDPGRDLDWQLGRQRARRRNPRVLHRTSQNDATPSDGTRRTISRRGAQAPG